MARLMAWVRYRGWRNFYWREDWYHTLCSHPAREWFAEQLICLNCGAVIAVYAEGFRAGRP